MSSSLRTVLENPQLAQQLLSEAQTRGFVTAMAAAPHLINPSEWLAFMWGGEESSPFTSKKSLKATPMLLLTFGTRAAKHCLKAVGNGRKVVPR